MTTLISRELYHPHCMPTDRKIHNRRFSIQRKTISVCDNHMYIVTSADDCVKATKVSPFKFLFISTEFRIFMYFHTFLKKILEEAE